MTFWIGDFGFWMAAGEATESRPPSLAQKTEATANILPVGGFSVVGLQ
jgi:hypothetical protein